MRGFYLQYSVFPRFCKIPALHIGMTENHTEGFTLDTKPSIIREKDHICTKEMNTMDFSHLNYFRVVARYGNLSRAAKELYISQPGLSRYLSRLEEEVGVPLFDRRKGKISLNTYGQIFLGNVNLAFEQLEQGIETMQQLYSRDQNILTVSCSIEDFLVDRLKEFSPQHPEIGIRQYTCSLTEMEQQLLRNNLDFAISAHPIQNDRIRYDQLSNCPYVLICHENNPLAEHQSIYLSQAKDQYFLCENSRLTRHGLERICKQAGFSPHVSHEIESGYILLNLLEAGTGVVLAPLAHALKFDTQVPGHHLRILHLKDEELPRAEIGIVYLAERKQTASTICFMEYLHQWSDQEMVLLKERLKM